MSARSHLNPTTLCKAWLMENRSSLLSKGDGNEGAVIKIRSGNKIIVTVGPETVVLWRPTFFGGMKNPEMLTARKISELVTSHDGPLNGSDSELFLLGLLMFLSEGHSLAETLAMFDTLGFKPIDFIKEKLTEVEDNLPE